MAGSEENTKQMSDLANMNEPPSLSSSSHTQAGLSS